MILAGGRCRESRIIHDFLEAEHDAELGPMCFSHCSELEPTTLGFIEAVQGAKSKLFSVEEWSCTRLPFGVEVRVHCVEH